MRGAVWLLLLAAGPVLAQAPVPVEFRLAFPTLEKKLRAPDPATRTAALAELKRFPHPEAVKLVQPLVLKDPDPEVRAAAVATLLGFKDEASVRAHMLNTLKREITEDNAVYLAVLLAVETPATRKEVFDLLNRTLKVRPAATAHVIAAVDYVASRPDLPVSASLVGLRQLESFTKDFGFRRCLVQALIALRHKDAMTALIDLVGTLDGEVQLEIAEHLTRTTGQPHRLDGKAWKQWWQANQAAFEFPPPGAAPRASLLGDKQEDKGASYYGIPIHARRLVFVMDTSGSMAGNRLVSAKRELTQTIEGLPGRTHFNIVIFNTQPAAWNRTLVEISDLMRRQARDHVNGLQALGFTNTFDALRLALDMKAEAIYLLTDGQPTSGAIVEVNAILLAVKQLNRTRRLTIHTIGISPGEDNIFSKFLKELSAQNWGQYRQVD